MQFASDSRDVEIQLEGLSERHERAVVNEVRIFNNSQASLHFAKALDNLDSVW